MAGAKFGDVGGRSYVMSINEIHVSWQGQYLVTSDGEVC